jgi:3-deoxy-D-manno-octulosonic-acid transferase
VTAPSSPPRPAGSRPDQHPAGPGGARSGCALHRLYDLLFTLALAGTAPFWLWRLARRGEWRRGFGERFGRYSPALRRDLAGGGAIWLHAVSVGEANLAARLAGLLAARLPSRRFVVSATTNTGRRALETQLPTRTTRLYFPLDRRAWVARALDTVRPAAIVLVEAEIWPNFLAEAARRNIPVLLVNARVSERSARRYQRFGPFFRDRFTAMTAVLCPTTGDAARLVALGCRPEVVRVVGHPKFDTVLPSEDQIARARHSLDRLGVPPGARVIVGGSTHAGEEALLAGMYRSLRRGRPDLFLVLVPRHFERCAQAARDIRAAGIEPVLHDPLPEIVPRQGQTPRCLLVNTTGELRAFYALADVVFVGKSLTARGGQNPVEPAALGRAIVTGPHLENFRAIQAEFRRHDAVCQVADAAALESALAQLLDDPERRNALGARARQVVDTNRGALDRTADVLAEGLNSVS